jgi:replicative DNA helicase
MDDNAVYDIDAEMSVLGSLMIDGERIAKVMEILTHEDFYERRNELVFRGMEWLAKKGIEIDIITLSDALKQAKVLDEIGGSAYLAEVTNYVPTSLHVLNYAKIVADHSAKRKINKMAVEMSEMSTNGASLEETLAKVKEKISEVNNLGGKENKYQVASMLDYIDEAQERYDNWGKMQGLSTGFPSIDKLTLGLVGGELIIVAGQTSRGKTLLSMNIANNIAKTGKTVLFVTLEMTHAELTSRYMFVNGGAGSESFGGVAANTLFQANDELDWKDIDGLIKNAKEELNVDLVVIDHLHYFTRELANVAEDLGRITKEFKKNAIRYNIPIILISHVRKMAKDEQLSGESLRGSSLIAQDADIVLLVDRDPETNAMGVMVDKNRNRGKLSDRTKDWQGKDEREINTIFLEFNNTKLHDPEDVPKPLQQLFPGSVSVPLNE